MIRLATTLIMGVISVLTVFGQGEKLRPTWANLVYGESTLSGRAMGHDAKNNLYVAGKFTDTIDLDISSSTKKVISNGREDIFFAKYDPDGNMLWAKSIGGGENDMVTSLIIDQKGNLILVGDFQSEVDFDPGAGETKLTSAGSTDAFVAKYNSDGDFIFVKQVGGTGQDRSTRVAVDEDHNIAVCGYVSEKVDLDPGLDSQIYTAVAAIDIFAIYLDESGNFKWGLGYGHVSGDYAGGVVVTDSCVIITGYASGTIDFNPLGKNPEKATLSSIGAFLAAYDKTTGRLKWLNTYTTVNNRTVVGFDLKCDKDYNLYITGYRSDEIDFGSLHSDPPGANSAYLLKLDKRGKELWLADASGQGASQGWRVAISPGGDTVVVTGYATRPTRFDPQDTLETNHLGSRDGFVAIYEAKTGKYVHAFHLGYLSQDNGWDVSCGKTGFAVTGDLYAKIDFSPYPDESVQRETTTSKRAAFFAQYDVREVCTPANTPKVGIQSDTVCVGEVVKLFLKEGSKLNSDENWYFRSQNCGGPEVGKGEFFILPVLIPGDYRYYVRGEGSICSSPDSCTAISFYTLNRPDDQVKIVGNELVSSDSFAAYQWIDCDNGNAPIKGANGMKFSPAKSGNYAVIVSTSWCSDTSDCLKYVNLGMENSGPIHPVVYPNPFGSSLNIVCPKGPVNVLMYDMTGQLVYGESDLQGGDQSIDLPQLRPGLYVTEIHSEGLIYRFKTVRAENGR